MTHATCCSCWLKNLRRNASFLTRLLSDLFAHEACGVALPAPSRAGLAPAAAGTAPIIAVTLSPARGHATPSHSTVHHVSAKEHVDGYCPRTTIAPRARQCRPRDVAARWTSAHVARDRGPGWRRTGHHQQSGNYGQGAQPPARSPRHI